MLHAMTGRIAVVVCAMLLAAGGGWLWFDAATRAPDDPVAAFLARHWHRPLPAQGEPPARFGTLEASLDPADCGACHAEQFRDWSASLHSHTMGNGILWQTHALPPDQVSGCLDCHAPLAEQKALLARELNWPNAPRTAVPAYVPPDLHRKGLVCAACHVRAHLRYGPPPAPGVPSGDTPGLPHDGYRQSEAFADSRFCATCHQFPDSGPALNGKPLENTLAEWQASRHAAEGRTCQSCHMPDRRHLWRGIHDPDMVRQALTTRLSIDRGGDGTLNVSAEVRNSGAGHYFPTYLVPRVVLRLVAENNTAAKHVELARAVITRDIDVWLTQERSDTRLAPDAVRELAGRLPPPRGPGWRIALIADVAPREHYERMFAAVIRENGSTLAADIRSQLDAALAEARASHYTVRLDEQPLGETIAN